MHRRRWGVGLTSVLVLGFLAWCLMSPSKAVLGPPEHVEPAPAAEAPPVVAEAPPVVVARSPQRKSLAPTHPSPEVLPSRPVGSDAVNRIGMPSHPYTAAHQRIYRENNLIGDLNGAMDVGDVAGLRRLLSQYREEYPEDAHVLQDGYELIANCLERLDPETRAIAQRYYDEELDSGLRRYIRRHCLEAPDHEP